MVPSLKDHHIQDVRRHNVPFVLCTDDKGVFETTLSHEYYLAAVTFGLTRDELCDLARRSFDYSFLPENERTTLIQRLFPKDVQYK